MQELRKVKQEKLDWLAGNPFVTKRFAFFVGRRCRTMTIKDVAEETRLDWKTIKDLDQEYMREQLRRAGKPAPKVSASTRSRSIGPHLPDRGQRLGAAAADLVRGQGPLGREYGRVLQVAGPDEE